MQRVEKAWGYEEIIVNQPEYCAKRLHISPGKKCSLHYHEIKKETFHVEEGEVFLERPPMAIMLGPGEQRTITPKVAHRFSSKDGATILEISTHHSDYDVVRLEPSGDMP